MYKDKSTSKINPEDSLAAEILRAIAEIRLLCVDEGIYIGERNDLKHFEIPENVDINAPAYYLQNNTNPEISKMLDDLMQEEDPIKYSEDLEELTTKVVDYVQGNLNLHTKLASDNTWSWTK
ncbi:hypothetical protein IKG49_01790 [Candidatus Saccharibacteria bacterium]|nr:hypothetical protein [Candidatus Saccharibacteria bacterium]